MLLGKACAAHGSGQTAHGERRQQPQSRFLHRIVWGLQLTTLPQFLMHVQGSVTIFKQHAAQASLLDCAGSSTAVEAATDSN